MRAINRTDNRSRRTRRGCDTARVCRLSVPIRRFEHEASVERRRDCRGYRRCVAGLGADPDDAVCAHHAAGECTGCDADDPGGATARGQPVSCPTSGGSGQPDGAISRDTAAGSIGGDDHCGAAEAPAAPCARAPLRHLPSARHARQRRQSTERRRGRPNGARRPGLWRSDAAASLSAVPAGVWGTGLRSANGLPAAALGPADGLPAPLGLSAVLIGFVTAAARVDRREIALPRSQRQS